MEKMKCQKCGSPLRCGKIGSGTISKKDERDENFPELFDQYKCVNKDCSYYLKDLTILGS